MNPGGEPERDETGLPPVDIEIPDDARELDRDVQAYYRELRAERRQQRGLRLRGSLAKDGIVLPLLACCLILALITGTLLTVFTATSDQNLSNLPGTAKTTPSGGAAGSRTPSSGAPSSSATAPAQAGAPSAAPQPASAPGILPQAAAIALPGQAPTLVRDLSRAALVLIPARCNCTATVGWLVDVVTGAHAQPYLVYTPSTKSAAEAVYASLSSTTRAQVTLAQESGSPLSAGIPGNLPAGSLTAILLGPRKQAIYATGLRPQDDPTALIQALTH